MATTVAAPPTAVASSEPPKADGAPTNPRGIPYAPFVDRVEDYVTQRAEVEGTLKRFQEMIQKYQFMEANQQRRAAGLKIKIPDIQKTLDVVRFLKRRWPAKSAEGAELEDEEEKGAIETTFELNDTLFAKAIIPRTEEVYLWLGANVMLAYPVDEAEELLVEKLRVAKTSLENCEEDQDFLREQITTLEVATARVYNWDVGQRRKEREATEGSKKDGEGAASNG